MHISTEIPIPTRLDDYIVSTPDTLGGRPRIAGHRIAVTHVKNLRLRLGMSFEEIAQAYNLPIAAIYAAMAYYYVHKAEIDQSDADGATFVEDFKQRNPSVLAGRVAKLNNAA